VQLGTKKWCQCVTRDGPDQASDRLQRLYLSGEIVLRAHTVVRVYLCVGVGGLGSSYLYHHTLIYRNNNPKAKSSDAGSASKPKRRHDILSISEKVKILDMIGIKKIMRRLPCSMARTNLPYVK
jgi:hypothetical protein